MKDTQILTRIIIMIYYHLAAVITSSHIGLDKDEPVSLNTYLDHLSYISIYIIFK